MPKDKDSKSSGNIVLSSIKLHRDLETIKKNIEEIIDKVKSVECKEEGSVIGREIREVSSSASKTLESLINAQTNFKVIVPVGGTSYAANRIFAKEVTSNSYKKSQEEKKRKVSNEENLRQNRNQTIEIPLPKNEILMKYTAPEAMNVLRGAGKGKITSHIKRMIELEYVVVGKTVLFDMFKKDIDGTPQLEWKRRGRIYGKKETGNVLQKSQVKIKREVSNEDNLRQNRKQPIEIPLPKNDKSMKYTAPEAMDVLRGAGKGRITCHIRKMIELEYVSVGKTVLFDMFKDEKDGTPQLQWKKRGRRQLMTNDEIGHFYEKQLKETGLPLSAIEVKKILTEKKKEALIKQGIADVATASPSKKTVYNYLITTEALIHQKSNDVSNQMNI